MSAVTTPRAAWAEEGGSILDDARVGGGSTPDDISVSASVFRSDDDGAEPILMKDGTESRTYMMPASTVVGDPANQTESTRLLDDTGVLHQPTRATFGRPTTKVC